MVFDCNVYLDVARLLGSPFTQSDFTQAAARLVSVPVPHPGSPASDSLRAIAVCTSGIFFGEERLEVWSSDHIVDMVEYKAHEPTTPKPGSDLKGLGWSSADAVNLVEDLVMPLVRATRGELLTTGRPEGNPPLDHEDGLVFGLCRYLSDHDPLSQVYCVTNDGGFLQAYKDGELGDHTIVLTPARFLTLVRAARGHINAAQAISRMPRPTITATTA